jgi:hypothetical protein
MGLSFIRNAFLSLYKKEKKTERRERKTCKIKINPDKDKCNVFA